MKCWRDFVAHIQSLNRLPVSHTASTFPGYEEIQSEALDDFEWISGLIN